MACNYHRWSVFTLCEDDVVSLHGEFTKAIDSIARNVILSSTLSLKWRY